MCLISKPSSGVLLAAAFGLTASPALPETLELLTLGDSITFGVGSDTDPSTVPNPDDLLGGYRYYLDRLSLPGYDFEFVGNRSTGSGLVGDVTPFTDNQHFGIRSGEASLDKTDTPSTLTGIFNSGPGVTSEDAAFNSATTKPDAVLLRIGINSFPKDGFNTPASAGGSGTRLQGDIDLAVAQFNTLLDGDVTRPSGLVSRLNDTNYFASDAHLFVALITPRLNGDTSNPNSAAAYLNRKAGAAIAQYNSEIKSSLESRMGPGGELEGRVTFVDLFSISLQELNLQALADEFFGGNLGQLIAAISPHDDSLDGGLDYVDWTTVATFDEGDNDNGAFDFDAQIIGTEQDLLPGNSGTGDLLNANLALLGDGLHPTNLGYAIEAQVWANAINSAVPEPSAMALLLGGGMLMATRRRRRDGASA